MKERQNTKEPGFLDRILTDIFERELAAYADVKDDEKWAKERPDSGNGNNNGSGAATGNGTAKSDGNGNASGKDAATSNGTANGSSTAHIKGTATSNGTANGSSTAHIKGTATGSGTANGNGRKSSKVIAADSVTGLDKMELTEGEETTVVAATRTFDSAAGTTDKTKSEKEAAAELSEKSADSADQEVGEPLSSFSNPLEDPYSETDLDNWSYEVPRPWLSLQEASSMLGRSERALERSILGRWGNRLPEGWSARKVRIDGKEEWRIIPPPGFRVKHSRRAERARIEEPETEEWPDTSDEEPESNSSFGSETQAESALGTMDQSLLYGMDAAPPQRAVKRVEDRQLAQSRDLIEPGPFSLEKLLQSATKLAQKELSAFAMPATKQRREPKDNYETTIVIDRSDEVERLLRELADCQKELAQERRQHLDDLRVMHEMQNSMRLLEVRAVETRELKEDLTLAQEALVEHRKQYQEFLALPWWRRLFHKK